MAYALKAAEELAEEGIEAEVIDLRTIRPMDIDTIIECVKKTNRWSRSRKAGRNRGVGAEIAARVMEQAFDYLDAPVLRVTGKDVPMPYAANLEKLALPMSTRSSRRCKAVSYKLRERRTMPINILMPALSPTMEEGNLAKWLMKEGDTVKSGDVIAEIETDKATMEVEAVDEGIVAKIVVPEGTEDVKVNDVIALLAGEGEDAERAPAPAEPRQQPRQGEAPSLPRRSRAAARPQHPRAETAAARAGAAAAAPAPHRRRPGRRGDRVFASPLAGGIAKEAGVDLARSQGSGPHGRIVETRCRAGAGRRRRPLRPGRPRRAAPQQPAAAPARRASDEQVKACSSRLATSTCRMTACARPSRERLTESKQTDPAFLPDASTANSMRCWRCARRSTPPRRRTRTASRLQALGQRLGHQGAGARAARVPEANASWTEDAHAQAQARRCRRRGRRSPAA